MKQVLLSSSRCRWRTWRQREVLTNIFLSITQPAFEPKRSDYRLHMIIQSTFKKIFLKIFLCRSFLKFLLNLLQYSFYFIFLCFFFFFFLPKTCGILVFRPGIEPVPPCIGQRSQPLDGQGSPNHPFLYPIISKDFVYVVH